MTFSRQLISVVSAALLAAHVVIGCCAHHEHPAMELASVASGHCHAHGDAHHLASDATDPQDSEQSGEHSCSEGGCSFLAATRLVMPELTQVAAFDVLDAIRLNEIGPSSWAGDVFGLLDSQPHVRTHLTKCVLLV